MTYLGDMTLGSTIFFKFTTVGTSGVPTNLAGTTSTTLSIYPNGSTTQITAGATLTTDFDGITGLNAASVALTGGNGFAVSTDYSVVLATGTVGGTNVLGYVVGDFSIQNRNTILAPQSINSATFSAGAITSTTFTTGAIGATTFIANAIGATTFASGAIVATTFGAGAITSTVLAAGAITSTTFTTGAIAGTTFLSNAIVATTFGAGAIVATTFAAGAITSTVIAAGALTSTTFTTNAIVGTTLSVSALTAISDQLLMRNMASVADVSTDTFRVPMQAFRQIRNKWSINGTTITYTKEDDTTSSFTATLSTSSVASAIVGFDPTG